MSTLPTNRSASSTASGGARDSKRDVVHQIVRRLGESGPYQYWLVLTGAPPVFRVAATQLGSNDLVLLDDQALGNISETAV